MIRQAMSVKAGELTTAPTILVAVAAQTIQSSARQLTTRAVPAVQTMQPAMIAVATALGQPARAMTSPAHAIAPRIAIKAGVVVAVAAATKPSA
jgi:hypothetical protein